MQERHELYSYEVGRIKRWTKVKKALSVVFFSFLFGFHGFTPAESPESKGQSYDHSRSESTCGKMKSEMKLVP